MHIEHSRTQERLQLPPPWEAYTIGAKEQIYEISTCTHQHGPQVTANTGKVFRCPMHPYFVSLIHWFIAGGSTLCNLPQT
jgi:hypothetical protein